MGKTRGHHVYKYIYRQSSISACCSFNPVTCDCRNSHSWSRQAEACQHLERRVAPYCIGIKHKYTNANSDFNAPHWVAFIFFFFLNGQKNNGLGKRKKKQISKCKETWRMLQYGCGPRERNTEIFKTVGEIMGLHSGGGGYPKQDSPLFSSCVLQLSTSCVKRQIKRAKISKDTNKVLA